MVIGAGPSGSHAARRLAEQGLHVGLIDRNSGPRRTIVCSGIIGSEAYDRLDLSASDVVQAIHRARFFSPAGYEVLYETPRPFAYVVDRTAFDGLLLRRAAAAGAEYLPETSARDLEYGRRGVTLKLRRSGETLSVETQLVVVASGHQRWVRRADVGAPRGYIHGIHAQMPFRELDSAELYFGREVAPGFFAWIVPFGIGWARLGLLSHRRGQSFFHRFLMSEPVRSRRVDHDSWKPSDGVQTCSRGLVQGLVDPSYGERLILIGEAAGHVKTTTGGGIHYGVVGAEIAAEVAAEGFAGKGFSARALQRYQTRCWARLENEVLIGLELQRLARSVADLQVDELFEALQDGLGKTMRKVIEFDWHRHALRILMTRWPFLAPTS